MKRSVRLVASLAAISMLLAAVGSAQAKQTKKVKFKAVIEVSGNSFSGKVSGDLGKGTVTGMDQNTAVFPLLFHTKAGNAKINLKVTKQGDVIPATWKAAGGTGKYKRLKGKGTAVVKTGVSGGSAGLTVTFKGKVTY